MWLATIISFFSSAILLFAIVKLSLLFPGKSLVQYSVELLGKISGGALASFYLFLFLFMGGTDLRLYGEVIKTGFLPRTPLVVIISIIAISAVLVVFCGVEPIGRSADIIFPLFLLMILASFIVPLFFADFGNLQPVLSRGWAPVLLAAIVPTTISAVYTNLTMIAPSISEEKRTIMNSSLWSLLASSLFLVFFSIAVISVLGPSEGFRATFPTLKMIRSISISTFLERVEALTIFPWGLGLFINLSLNLYSGSKGLSQIFGLRDNRLLILPMAVIWVTFSIQGYQNSFEILEFFEPLFHVAGFYFLLLVPLLVLWVAYLLKRLRKQQFPHQKEGTE
jgi:spore germination protein KB